MKRINFAEYQKKRQGWLKQRAALGIKRGPANRPRDEEERALLLRLNKARWERWLATGKLRKLGPRRYRFQV